MKLYVAFIAEGGARGRQVAGRIILDNTSMPLHADSIKLIEDEIERRADADRAFITYMYELED